MPVNFLTEEQRRCSGRFNADPDEAQLGGFFHLDADARRRAMAAQGARSQLGWAVQLGTVRYLDTFLPNPEDVPTAVVDYVAAQLGLDPGDLKGYGSARPAGTTMPRSAPPTATPPSDPGSGWR